MVTCSCKIFGKANVVSHKVKGKSAQAAFLLSPTGLLVRKESSHPVLDFLNDWRMTVELNLSSSCPLD